MCYRSISLDYYQLKTQARKGTLKHELQLIYISPLKSLAGDIRENFRRPLDGIFEEVRSMNPGTRSMPYDITVAIRTGDTSTSERRSMIKTPPHILITTPESLIQPSSLPTGVVVSIIGALALLEECRKSAKSRWQLSVAMAKFKVGIQKGFRRWQDVDPHLALILCVSFSDKEKV